MLTFKKADGVKYVDPNSALIPLLVEQGWVSDDAPKAKEVDGDLDALRAEAEALGLKVHHKTGAEKLAALIAEAKAEA